jgi:putative aldouronate transport system permease protein
MRFRRRRRIKRSLGEICFDVVNVFLLFLLAVVMIYPFWYVLVYSLNDSQDAASGRLWFYPRKPTLENVLYILRRPLLQRAYFVTVARTIAGPLVHLVVTGFAAYALSKRYLPGRKAITYFLIVPMFVGAPLVGTYVVYARLQLLNNFLVYILPGAFAFFMMAIARALFEEIPSSLEESAKMDGAGYIRIFFRLILPLSTPIVATILIFSAVGNWLDFFTNLVFVQTEKLTTLQFLLYQIVQQKAASSGVMGPMQMQATQAVAQFRITTETVKATTLVVITLPIIFVYPFFQGYIIKGMLIGAIKE